MTAKDIVRQIMAEKGFSQERLANESGMKRQSNVTGILNRGTSLRVDILEQLVSAMGYEVVIRPAGSEGEGFVVHEEKNVHD